MKRDINALTRAYRTKGILVDSNLPLLFLVGAMDREQIPKFKRTMTFAPEDFDTLVGYLALFSKRITTPNVLTEVSNLGNSLPENLKQDFWSSLNSTFSVLSETYVPSEAAIFKPECARFGLTDTAITTLVRGKYLLLTEDLRLSQFFQNTGGDVVNFNHLRLMNWNL